MDIGSIDSTETRRRKLNIMTFAHTLNWVFAALISLFLICFSLWFIYDEYISGTYTGISGWSQTLISFFIGVWITDRPKFIKR